MITKSVAEINEYVGSSVNPMATPDQIYELYSVPSFESGSPEIVLGADIGSTKVIVEDGDILICKINPRINRVWVVHHNTEYPLLASSEWIVVRNATMNSDYLKWYFSSPRFRTLLSSQVTGIGGSLTRAQPKQVAKYPVPIPSRDEQDCIADILARVDYLMHKYQQQIISIEQLVKSRFIELFGDYDLTHPQESWATIKEVGAVVGGATPKTDHDEYWGGSYRWITPAELDADSGYIYDSVRKLTKAGVESCSLQEMPVGTVILSSRAPIGKVAIAGNTFYCNQGFKNIICKEGITPRYLYTVLLLNVEYLNSLGRGATFKEISKGIVESIRIPVPSMDLQQQFAAFVEQTDKSKLAVQKGLQELEILKKSLMQQFFG